jgi:hypothetical protein
MNVSSAFHATTKVALAAGDRDKWRLVGQMPGHFVLQSELFFLQAVEKVFVGVGSVLFLVDQGVKSGMLRLEFLDICLAHRCDSFQHSVVTTE